jgi:SRSO17 transposase
MTESETVTESMRRSSFHSRIIYLASRIFSGGLKWAADWQTEVKPALPMDTGFPKQGKHSVGVARQYCGQLGKQDNCQVAVTLSLANHHASLPVAYRLYLPKEWADDEERCRKAGVPDDIAFKTKPEIALEQVRWARQVGLPRGVVLMDAGYGASTELRSSITALDLTYVAGILPNTTVWATGEEPLPPKKSSGR